jgi:DNA-binding MarR family transcriptional regulator
MTEQELGEWADEVGAGLRRLRRLLRKSFDADLARADLTAPQVSLLSALAAEDGQGLSGLSERLHLSHSTVSGIVDRLARKGLVERRVDPVDRRVSRVFLTGPVSAYTRQTLPGRQHGPLLRVAGRTTPEVREVIRDGLAHLRRLLEMEARDDDPAVMTKSDQRQR